MPTIRAIAVADTVATTPRYSSTVSYDGTSTKSVLVQLVCPTWSTADPAQTVTIDVQQSFDNEVTWNSFSTLVTQGARVGRTGGLPQMMCQCVDGLGIRRIRIVLSVSIGSLNAGVDLTT